MIHKLNRRGLAAIAVLLILPGSVVAQSTVRLGGRAFSDYYYIFSSPVEAEEGLHGFAYRRLYLTADFRLSDRFSGRARLEANDGTVGPKGPEPFVKDLFLRWNYSGEQMATLGVQPPPAFQVAERVWGYRSLEKTSLDFAGVVNSRDFGVRLDGPIISNGRLRYAAMVGNNRSVFPENDRFKRLYGQIEARPTDVLVFTLGADRAGAPAPLESATRLSAFAGYAGDVVRVGLEGFRFNRDFDDGSGLADVGISFFGVVALVERWDLIGRVDRLRQGAPGEDLLQTFVIAAVAYQAHENVRFIPNVWIRSRDLDDEARGMGRFTVDVRF